ncbi:hypothetical protein [Methylocapsa acidiphila]|uniref:hypothetical protein n=1 Tax=Methylocapsa acidiphila TaxID=133552 RepID=UPI000401FDEF|nr:hypothetical protein [Methylocapsa acidiphila]
MPYYLYEIPARKYREERNWPSEKEARSAIKHVARRAIAEGGSKEDMISVSAVKTGEKLFEGTVGAAANP